MRGGTVFSDRSIVATARLARREPTRAEALAWELLRDRRMLGLRFRRQQVALGFRLDFYCAELRVALELDGSAHDDPAQAEYDEVRSEALARAGVRVLRLRNEALSRDALEHLLSPFTTPTEAPPHVV